MCLNQQEIRNVDENETLNWWSNLFVSFSFNPKYASSKCASKTHPKRKKNGNVNGSPPTGNVGGAAGNGRLQQSEQFVSFLFRVNELNDGPCRPRRVNHMTNDATNFWFCLPMQEARQWAHTAERFGFTSRSHPKEKSDDLTE